MQCNELVMVTVFTHALLVCLQSSGVMRVVFLINYGFNKLRVVAIELTRQRFGRNWKHQNTNRSYEYCPSVNTLI